LARRVLPLAVSTGGLDSSNGAGVTLDASVGRVMGVHFAVVPSAVVAETPDGVEAVEPVPVGLYSRMLRLHLPHASAVKASLLATPAHVEALAEALSLNPGARLVLDPVYEAGAGGLLVAGEPSRYLEAVARLLVPRASLVAANAPEAEALTGVAVVDEESALRAARRLVEMGAGAAVVKGGHLGGDRVVDVYADALGRTARTVKPRSGGCSVHGGGCVFSAVAAASLALGASTLEAFHAASAAAGEAVAHAYRVPGAGRCVADPARRARLARGLLESMWNVRRALALVSRYWDVLEPLVPETGMNIAEAPVDAAEPGEVAAVEGRVTRGPWGPVHGCPWPGASSHMARLLLALRRHGVDAGAVVNARPLPWLLEGFRRLGLRVLRVDRGLEPEPGREGGTMEWVAGLVASHGGADLVYDDGAPGKEPMARVIAGDAVEAVERLVAAALAAGRHRG